MFTICCLDLHDSAQGVRSSPQSRSSDLFSAGSWQYSCDDTWMNCVLKTGKLKREKNSVSDQIRYSRKGKTGSLQSVSPCSYYKTDEKACSKCNCSPGSFVFDQATACVGCKPDLGPGPVVGGRRLVQRWSRLLGELLAGLSPAFTTIPLSSLTGSGCTVSPSSAPQTH